MKANYKLFVYTVVIITFCASCDLNLQHYDSKSTDVALETEGDIEIATYGNYAAIVAEAYTRYFLTLNEWPGDNVIQSGADGDQASLAASYKHIPNMYPTTDFWRQSYKLIYGANQILSKIEEGQSDNLNQLKGENY